MLKGGTEMQKMRFSEKQSNVTVYELEDARDVIICLNEKEIEEEHQYEATETGPESIYEYDGNIFRTHKLTKEEIESDPKSYLDYDGDEAPSDEMVEYANQKIDEYTAQLMYEGLI